MTTELRFVLAVVLVVGVLVVTNMLFPPAKPPVRPTTSADSAAAASPAPRPTTAPGLSAAPPAPPAADTAAGSTVEPERDVVVEGPLYRYAFSTRGARLVSAELPQFKSFTREGPVELIGDRTIGALGLKLLVGRDTLDLGDAAFTPSVAHVAVGAGPAELSFRHVDPALTVEITYRFQPNDYLVEASGTVQGVERPLIVTDMGTGLVLNDQDSTSEAHSSAYVTNHLQTGISTHLLGDEEQSSVQNGPFLWAALKSKFFVLALLPRTDGAQAEQFGGVLVRVPTPGQVQVAVTESAGADGRFGYRAYVGPLEIPRLSAIGADLDDVYQYRPGFLRPMVRPLVGLITGILEFLHDKLNIGYGWVLVLFGLLMRIVLWPFTQSQMKSQMKNMAVQPLVKEIQTKYKDKPEKLQQEMMKLYKEHGFNPFAGCLPMLLPWPVLISLYFVFQNAIRLRGVSFGWMPDLSAPDPVFILPVILGISMFLLQWIAMRSMPDPNPQLKMMMWFMPIMMVFIFYRLAAGLNLYYAVSNLATLPQQFWLSRQRGQVQPPGKAK